MNDSNELCVEDLKYFEPIAGLAHARLKEVVELSRIEFLDSGVSVFHENETDNHTVYLLEGDVQCTSLDNKTEKTITAYSREAKYPLDDSQPHQISCVTLSKVKIVRIDNDILDYMMMWDEIAVSKAQEIESGDEEKDDAVTASEQYAAKSEQAKEWMNKVQDSLTFKNLSPANVKKLFECMQAIPVQAGDIIVDQGDPGDFYYILTEGQAKVTRTIELATLEAGAAFGEEAIVAKSRRNASVTMKSEGMVMRLQKKDFVNLLVEPNLVRQTFEEAKLEVEQGAIWLDVRHAKEYHRGHFLDAVNIPLHELRMRMEELDKGHLYICCCRIGQRSSAAAFLLMQNGFRASLLVGGVQDLTKDLISE